MNPQAFFLNDLRLRKREATQKITLYLQVLLLRKSLKNLLSDQSYLDKYTRLNMAINCFSFEKVEEPENKMFEETNNEKVDSKNKENKENKETIEKDEKSLESENIEEKGTV